MQVIPYLVNQGLNAVPYGYGQKALLRKFSEDALDNCQVAVVDEEDLTENMGHIERVM